MLESFKILYLNFFSLYCLFVEGFILYHGFVYHLPNTMQATHTPLQGAPSTQTTEIIQSGGLFIWW